jgi:hypothetical protein
VKTGASVGRIRITTGSLGSKLVSCGMNSDNSPAVSDEPMNSVMSLCSRPFSICVFSNWFIAEVEIAKAIP